MALDASLLKLFVRARDLKVGLIVIKVCNLLKARWRVTARARLLHELFLELFLMNRRMAVGAEVWIFFTTEFKVVSWLCDLDKRNILFRGNVTAPTRLHLLVLPNQLKSRRVVIKGRSWIKLYGRVTGRAGLLIGLRRKLLLMRTRMAVDAEFFLKVRELINFFTLNQMARLTAYLLMRPSQRESRLIMEGWVPHDLALSILNIPALRCMTCLARNILKPSMKLRRMNCFMTAFTGLLGYAFEKVQTQSVRRCLQSGPTLGLVTIKTTILFMFSRDGETRLCTVIKFKLLFPVRLAVASLTVLCGCAHLVEHFISIAVVIGVTTRTGFLQTLKVEVFHLATLISGLVTVYALCCCMRAV